MKIFSKIYEYCIKLAKHPKATMFLVGNSFIESIFWPIPVDVILAPMCLAAPNKALRYALYATIASVLGAIIGYYLGYFCYDWLLRDFVENHASIKTSFQSVLGMLNNFGILFVIIGSFTPLPYKVVAICCGVAAAGNTVFGESLDVSMWQLNIFIFIIVSLLGRGARFFLIAGLLKLGGEKMEAKIHRYIDIIGIVCVVICVIAMIAYYLFK